MQQTAQELSYKRHPMSKLFGDSSKEEFEELVESIRENGQREAIIKQGNEILDGWRRYLACQKAGVAPKFAEWSGKGDLLKLVVDKNLNRRHYTPSQRAMVAAEIDKIIAKQIRDEMGAEKAESRLSNPRQDAEVSKKKPRNAAAEAAAITGASRPYVAEAKKIARASPKVAEEVREGKLTIPEAKRKLGIKSKPKPQKAPAVPGKSEVNGEVVADPPEIAAQRAKGTIPPDVVPKVDDPGETTTVAAIAEEIAEEKAMQDESGDQAWVDGLKLSGVLEGSVLRGFQNDALCFRAMGPAVDKFKHMAAQVLSKFKKHGTYHYYTRRYLSTDPPEKWKRCAETTEGGCSGQGMLVVEGKKAACKMCHGKGYRING